MICFLVKDIDEWNILSLENNILVKKKRSNIEDENFPTFYLSYLVTRILYHEKVQSWLISKIFNSLNTES